MNRSEWLDKIYDRLGGDLDGPTAVQIAIDLDDEQYQEHMARAGERQLVTDLKNLERRRLRTVKSDIREAAVGAVTLFDASEYETDAATLVRERIRFDGRSVPVANLAGVRGAEIAMEVATRDLGQALTTVSRARFMQAVARHVIAETERLGRDVSFGEVLGWGTAA